MLRVVFMGTPEFGVPTLAAIHKNFSVVGVLTQPDRPVGRGQNLRASPIKKKAQELGIPVFQPAKLSAPEVFKDLEKLKPDVIVVVAYGQILKKNVLELPRLGCVNLHSSLLPRWRGAAPIQWAILEGDAETGATTMRIVEKLDAGDVLLQKPFPIGPEDTAGVLHDKMMEDGAELMVQTLKGLESGELQGKPQEESQVTYAAKLKKEMESLDVEEPAQNLSRRVRALNPWPGTSLRIEDAGRLKVLKARLREDIQGKVGQVFEKAGMVLLATSQGSLELLELQWEGKKAVDSGGFLNGLRGQKKSLPLRVKK